MTDANTEERKLLGQIEPYVLMAASTFITCAYNRNFAPFELLARPQVLRSTARSGRVAFEAPQWLPVPEALLAVGDSGLNAVVKHLHIQRSEEVGTTGMRIHRFQLGSDLCRDGEVVSLVYSPWFRFAAPPYHFDVDKDAAAYVASALERICHVQGRSPRVEVRSDGAEIWLSQQLRVDLMGDGASLTDISIALGDDETHLGLQGPQLSISRASFPDVYNAVRRAEQSGEAFRGVTVIADDQRVLLCTEGDTANVQA